MFRLLFDLNNCNLDDHTLKEIAYQLKICYGDLHESTKISNKFSLDLNSQDIGETVMRMSNIIKNITYGSCDVEFIIKVAILPNWLE